MAYYMLMATHVCCNKGFFHWFWEFNKPQKPSWKWPCLHSSNGVTFFLFTLYRATLLLYFITHVYSATKDSFLLLGWSLEGWVLFNFYLILLPISVALLLLFFFYVDCDGLILNKNFDFLASMIFYSSKSVFSDGIVGTISTVWLMKR